MTLLGEVDDRFVIMGSGDEVTSAVRRRQRCRALASGWRRDFLLLVDGWAKDRDPNTAFSQTVEPLPFHGMSRYPYPAEERYPDTEFHRGYRREYNAARLANLGTTVACRRRPLGASTPQLGFVSEDARNETRGFALRGRRLIPAINH